MRGLRHLLRRAPRHGGRLAREVRRELEHHLDASTEHLVGQGLPFDAARAEARRRLDPLGDAERRLVPYARERERTMRMREWMASIAQDIRYAGRTLRRQPAVTVVIVATLALGIGANAAMYGILDRLLLSGPAHVRDADRVMRVYFSRPDGDTFSRMNYPTYAALRDATGSFDSLAASFRLEQRVLGEGVDIEHVAIQQSTWMLFPLLGVHPVAGRFFDAREDQPPAGEPVAVLSHDLWRRRFGADPSVIGRRIVLDSRPFTVIGVAPAGFTGPELQPVDLWVPMSSGLYAPRSDWPSDWGSKWLTIVGRLSPGSSPEAAGKEATAVYRQAYAGRFRGDRDLTLSLRPLLYDAGGNEPMEATVSRWLAGVAAIVLLVACANVANILLARGIERRREVVLRSALGITRGRLLRLLAAEGLVLAVAGGAAALLVAHWGAALIQSVLLPGFAWEGLSNSGRLLLFTSAASLVTAFLIIPFPALQATRIRLADSLKEGGSHASESRGRGRAVLTVVQAALSVVLLVGAGLFVQSLLRVQRLDLGIDADRVQAISLHWQRSADLSGDEPRAETARRQAVLDQALERLRLVPGVARASAAIGLPFDTAFGVPLQVPGIEAIPQFPGGGPYISAIGADYFTTVGTDLVRGRAFTRADGRGTEPVVIVSETMAGALWPDADPLGQCLLIGQGDPPCSRVVGVAEDTRRFQLIEEPAMQYYVPIGQERGIGGLALLVRPSDDAPVTSSTIQRELLALDPTLAYVTVSSLQERIDPQVRPWRLGATLFAVFGGLAFVMASVGLYSVVNYATAQRTREMGIRIALGAGSADLLRLVIRAGAAMAVAGIGLGVLLALLAGPRLEPLLFDTPVRSPVVFGTVIGVLLVSALVASVIPARRAARVDPVVVLRT